MSKQLEKLELQGIGKKVGAQGIPGPKTCTECGNRGQCKDTRQEPDVVTRRYDCVQCDHRWYSYEVTLTQEEIDAEEGDDE